MGRLAPGVEARIVDEHGLELGLGARGGVELRAAWVSAERGASAPGGRWFATGDVGYLAGNRELFIVGRSKEQISQGGVKISPQEIIDVVAPLRARDIEDSAAVGLSNSFLGEEVVLCVVRAPGSLISEADILAHCRAHLNPRKMPASVLFFESLPKTNLGKIKTHELQTAVEARRGTIVDTDLVCRLRGLAQRERRTALEAEIAACLWRILERTPGTPVMPVMPVGGIEHRATFGDLGLDSIGAVELANALSTLLGRAVPATVTFDHPTVDALCDHLLALHFSSPSPTASAKAPIDSARAPTQGHEPIAIVGIGCRLPGKESTVSDPEAFWELLRGGVDAVRVVPRARWNADDFYDPRRGIAGKTYTREGAFLEDPDLFDAEFFGVSPADAKGLDPQHRILLEVAWDAIAHAGISPARLSAGHTGVFVGITGSTYQSASFLGLLPCMASGRLSHVLDFSGPSIAIDTACSSSLVAVHMAVQSLRRGESDVALAGGVHVIASPRSFVHLSAIQALASDGRSKAFDARADGYGRGEGSVVFVLESLSSAIEKGDRVIAVIRGSAVNHDARTTSLTAPSGRAQRALIEAALRDAGIGGDLVDYLEAHGTGTRLGDPVELSAAVDALGSGRRRPLIVGSVKSNIGHLEAAAGASGMLRATLALSHTEVPPHLHFETLNPVIAPSRGRR